MASPTDETITDSQSYGLGGIPAGTYSVRFSKASLQDKIVDNVVMDPV